MYSFSEKNFLSFQNQQGFSILQTEKIEKEYKFFEKAKNDSRVIPGKCVEEVAYERLWNSCDSVAGMWFRKKVLLFLQKIEHKSKAESK